MLPTKRTMTTLTTLLGLAALTAQVQGQVALDLQAPIPGAEVSATCGACHPTAALDRALRSTHATETSCLSCHHVGFTNNPDEASRLRADGCISCHEDVSPAHHSADGSPDCVSCHTLHPQPGSGTQAEIVSPACGSCHQEVHPTHEDVSEGSPGCAQCHTTDGWRPAKISKASETLTIFDIDEDALPLGAAVLAETARRFVTSV